MDKTTRRTRIIGDVTLQPNPQCVYNGYKSASGEFTVSRQRCTPPRHCSTKRQYWAWCWHAAIIKGRRAKWIGGQEPTLKRAVEEWLRQRKDA